MTAEVSLLFSIVVSIVIFSFMGYRLTDYCHVAEQSCVYHAKEDQFNRFDPYYAPTTRRKWNAEPQPQLIIINQMRTQIADNNSGDNNSTQSSLRWWGKFICEIKATDVVIAFFTYCLVVVGIFQAYRSSHTLMSLERAYVFPAWTDVRVSESGKVRIHFRVRNVGRSPAVLKGFWIKFVQDGHSLPRRPNYRSAIFREFDWGIEPNVVNPDAVVIDSPYSGEQYIFGYIRYDDVFQKSRISRFGNRIFPDRIGERRGERAGGDPYNSYT
jgi:hypothetical protein